MITYVRIDGRYARVIDSGASDAPVLLCLHGFAGDADTWDATAHALEDDYRILAVDLPGHGAEGGASVKDCTMSAASKRLTSLLAYLHVPRATVIGYSMGGRLALWFALEHPYLVQALVLVGASPGLAEQQQRIARIDEDARLASEIEGDDVDAFVERWQRMPIFEPLESCEAQTRAEVREMRLRCNTAGLAASLRGMGTGAQPYLGERLAELTMPVLLCAGELDVKFTAVARDMQRSIENSRLEIVADSGHVVAAEQPERFHRLLRRFLGEVYQAAPQEAPSGAHT